MGRRDYEGYQHVCLTFEPVTCPCTYEWVWSLLYFVSQKLEERP